MDCQTNTFLELKNISQDTPKQLFLERKVEKLGLHFSMLLLWLPCLSELFQSPPLQAPFLCRQDTEVGNWYFQHAHPISGSNDVQLRQEIELSQDMYSKLPEKVKRVKRKYHKNISYFNKMQKHKVSTSLKMSVKGIKALMWLIDAIKQVLIVQRASVVTSVHIAVLSRQGQPTSYKPNLGLLTVHSLILRFITEIVISCYHLLDITENIWLYLGWFFNSRVYFKTLFSKRQTWHFPKTGKT